MLFAQGKPREYEKEIGSPTMCITVLSSYDILLCNPPSMYPITTLTSMMSLSLFQFQVYTLRKPQVNVYENNELFNYLAYFCMSSTTRSWLDTRILSQYLEMVMVNKCWTTVTCS